MFFTLIKIRKNVKLNSKQVGKNVKNIIVINFILRKRCVFLL